MLTTERRKPGPAPKAGPKVAPVAYSVYPKERAALQWWVEHRGANGVSDALRQMIDVAMSLSLGTDWAEQIEEKEVA